MLDSKFVQDILDLILDSDEDGKLLRQQIPFLTQTAEIEYTGMGVFYTFTHKAGISSVKARDSLSVLDGIEISSTELRNPAEAILHISNGLISSLEIWSRDGEYPRRELTNYRLVQVWQGSPGKQIELH